MLEYKAVVGKWFVGVKGLGSKEARHELLHYRVVKMLMQILAVEGECLNPGRG